MWVRLVQYTLLSVLLASTVLDCTKYTGYPNNGYFGDSIDSTALSPSREREREREVVLSSMQVKHRGEVLMGYQVLSFVERSSIECHFLGNFT